MSPHFRNLLSLLAGLAALTLFAGPVGPASAGEYDVWSCRGPVGQPLSTEAWKPRASDAVVGDVTYSESCATGGWVALGISPSSTGSRRPRLEYVFDLPRGEKITSYRMLRGLRAAASSPGYFYFAAIREVDNGVVNEFGCASALALPNFPCGSEGSLSNPSDPNNVLDVNPISLDELGLFVSCAASGCTSPFPFAADAVLYQARVTIADNTPPAVVDLGGSLTRGRPSFGDASLFVEAIDDNAGVSSISLEIDGIHQQTINLAFGSCQQPYVRARPCPADAGRNFDIDTSTLSEGVHAAGGTVTDAAGNQTSYGPINFTVKKPDPDTSNGVPAVRIPKLELDRTSPWHAIGKPKTISGRLSTTLGLPIGGAQLEVRSIETTSTGSREQRMAPVTTNPDGRFQITVSGQGARRVRVFFSPGEGQAATAEVSTEVRTRLKLKLKASPKRLKTGKSVTFKGRLNGAGAAAAKVPLSVQAKVSGKWTTIASIKTRKGGQYRWKYRFKYVNRNAIFSFRIVAEGGPGWPWPSQNSVVRKVRIFGAKR